MTTLYKLTDGRCTSGIDYDPLIWGLNVTHTTSGMGPLCGSGWIHAYTSPELAILMNPIHADFESPILWRAEGNIDISDALKVGTKRLTTLEIIPQPICTFEHRIRFALFCALEVCDAPEFIQWAADWLSGQHRNTALYPRYITPRAEHYPDKRLAAEWAFLAAHAYAEHYRIWVPLHAARAAWAAAGGESPASTSIIDFEYLARTALTD